MIDGIGFDLGTVISDYVAPFVEPQPEAPTPPPVKAQPETPWILYGAVLLLGAIIIWADWR